MAQIATKWLQDDAVTNAKLNTDVAGNGLTGGSGSALTLSPDSITGGNNANVIKVVANGVSVGIDDTTIKEVGGQLVAQTALADEMFIEQRTITAGEITAKKLTLASTPADTAQLLMTVVEGGPQNNGVDYTVTTSPDELSWSALGLDGVIAANDVVVLTYPV